MSQFIFLQQEFPDIFVHAAKAERAALVDPRAACFYARLALEVAVKWMYHHDRSLRSPYETTLAALIHEPSFRDLVGQPLVAKAKIVKDLGNSAVHETRGVPVDKAVVVLRELFHIGYWLARTYGRAARPPSALAFAAEKLPQITTIEVVTLKRLQALRAQFEDNQRAREAAEKAKLASEAEREKLEAEIKQLQEEIAAVKAANRAVPDDHDYNEAETRDTFIDLLLAEAGWPLDQVGDREFEIDGMPNKTGKGFVDYVLWDDDGKPLGLIEAKRTKRDAREGQRQAELYADALEKTFGQRPIIFYSNGYEHWIWDDQRYPPRPIQGFLKKDELQLTIQRRRTLRQLDAEDIDEAIAGRFYQTRAIRRIAETFERDRQRKALLVMATGSGKTRTVIALADLLMRANWAKRILFLADRNALVNQAVNAFKKHLPQASPVNLVTDRSAQGRVYVSTYPTMVGLIDEEENGQRRFGPGHFDLIVIDEAHRSVYRKYKAIFDYFDSLLVGLTATPKDEIDRDTYGLFDLQRGVPTDAYDLDEAVKDGFLVPPQAISVPLKFQREGIRYDDLSDEEKERWDALEWDEDGGIPPDQVQASAINKWLFNQDTVDKVLEHLMTQGLRVNDGDRLGKTIIFAKNHDHAVFIAERFDASYPHLAGKFARVIDNRERFAQSLIDDFSNPEKAPHIAISVDMMDTGIDVPEAVNLVFFKVVRSKTKFWQMIGRGTRLCPDLFGPGDHKEHFYVFDFCQNFEFFNQNPELQEGGGGEPLGKRLFVTRVELVAEMDQRLGGEPLEDEPLTVLRRGVAALLQDEVKAMNPANFIVRPKRRLVEKYQEPDAWQALGVDQRLELQEEVAGLPSELIDDDLAAKQFDLLILQTQLAALRAEPTLTRHRQRIIAIASALEELDSVPAVRNEMQLIQDVQTDEFWQDVTLPMLEDVRRRLRALVKLIELKRRKPVYTDFEDELGESAHTVLEGVSVGTDIARFRRKVRHFLEANRDHLAIQKLRLNEPLTPTDLTELERVFIEAGVATANDLNQLTEETGGLGLFIRSLTGLDRKAAVAAFDHFIKDRQLTGNQLEFVKMIIDHLTERGVMDPGLLYDPPFTNLAPAGIADIFPTDAPKVVEILNEIRRRAAA